MDDAAEFVRSDAALATARSLGGEVAAIDPNDPAFIDAGIAARRRSYAAATPWIADPRDTEATAAAFIAEAVERGHYDPPGARPPEPRDRCTTNAIIIDAAGFAVSLVESVSAPYGAGVVVPGTGILLNNRIAGFNRDPAHVNGMAPRSGREIRSPRAWSRATANSS